MEGKIQQARRAAFEAWFTVAYTASKLSPRQTNCGILTDGYADPRVNLCWLGFNAALDSLEIKFPLEVKRAFHEYDLGYNEAVDSCRAAIESTNLGIKIK